MKLPAPPKQEVRWTVPPASASIRCGPELVSLGCHIEGASLPHPCLRDTWSAVLGTVKRSASQHPTAHLPTRQRFSTFVSDWLMKNLTPLEADADSSFLTWLTNTNYPHWKKVELLDLYESLDNACDDPKLWVNNCFIKQETYVDFKYPRGIYSRSDTAKLHIGPIVKLIEEEVYKNPYFIKHVPVADRPDYIMSHVYNPNCVSYLATDYTAFESQFTKDLMQDAEVQLLKYMTQHHHEREKFWWIIDNVMTGVNHCKFRNFRMFIEATRMSGEMTTSLSNGFSNLMFFLFTASDCGLKNVQGVVEGDDGLFSYDLPPGSRIPNEHDFAKLGLTIKIEQHEKLSTASFCGMVFDEEERIPITEPLKAVSNMAWMDKRFLRSRSSRLRSLLRCKALSMKSQYPACPILDAAASWILRCTAGCQTSRLMSSGVFGSYRTEQMKRNIARYERFDRDTSTGEKTRNLMSDKFGIPKATQIILEEWFDQQDTIKPIPTHLFGDCIPKSWTQNFTQFVWSLGSSPLTDTTSTLPYEEAHDLIRTQIVGRSPPRLRVPSHMVRWFQHTPIDRVARENLVTLAA